MSIELITSWSLVDKDSNIAADNFSFVLYWYEHMFWTLKASNSLYSSADKDYISIVLGTLVFWLEVSGSWLCVFLCVFLLVDMIVELIIIADKLVSWELINRSDI